MKHLVVAFVAMMLVSCTSAQVSTAVAEAQQACVSVGPLLAAGAASGNATAQSVAGYGNAVCGPLAAGSVPATVNSSTPTWLGSLAGIIQAVLPVAIGLL